MKYTTERRTGIAGLRRVSTPGLRVYAQADKLPRVLGGLGVAVLSTSKGLMTDREARQQRSVARCSVMSGERPWPGNVGEDARIPPADHRAFRGRPSIDDRTVVSKARRAELARDLPEPVTVATRGHDRSRRAPERRASHRALHGLTRTLVQNMVVGVTQGLEGSRDRRRRLPRPGRAPERSSSSRSASSHPVFVDAPEGISFEVPAPTRIIVRGDRQGDGRPGRRRHPQDPQARALQGQGRAVHGRGRAAQGRKGREVAMGRRHAHPRLQDRRHRRVRKKVPAPPERPRLAVFRSNRHIVAQVIDDTAGRRWRPLDRRG